MSLCIASLRMQPFARTYQCVAENMSAHGRHVATRGKTAAARLPSGIRCADEPDGVDISISLHTAMATLQRHGGSRICRLHIGSSHSSYCKTRQNSIRFQKRSNESFAARTLKTTIRLLVPLSAGLWSAHTCVAAESVLPACARSPTLAAVNSDSATRLPRLSSSRLTMADG